LARAAKQLARKGRVSRRAWREADPKAWVKGVNWDRILRLAFWSPPVRIVLFSAVFLGAYSISWRLPIISVQANFELVSQVLAEVARSDIRNVSRPDFAYALASEIVRVAAGVAIAFLICHIGLILALLVAARYRVGKANTAQDFQARFDEMSGALSNDFLLGDAWTAYAKTFVREQRQNEVRRFATVRPQAYFNASVARDHMFGLRLMPSIPGYFVGLGLLLTFVGLVIALSKAAHGTGTSADDMTASLRELLNAATFKFATSIAGLFSSLVLAFLFRSYAILIERGFERFCRALEPRLIYMTSQDLALRTHGAILEQKALLQEMTTAQYIQRLGAALGNAVGAAVGDAIAPIATHMDTDRKKGLEDLVQQFMETLRGSAGQEMTTLADVLKATTETLKNLRQDLADSGDQFAARTGEASAAFADLIKRAGGDLGRSTEGGRAAIEETMKALARAGEDMRRQLEENANRASATATAALDGALNEMLGNLSTQMQAFQAALTGFQTSLTEGAQSSVGAAKGVLDGTTKAADDAARSVRESFAGLLEALRKDTERVSTSLTSAEQTFSRIAGAAKDTVNQSNAAASAFGRVAENVERSSRPLLESAGRIEGAVARMGGAMTEASASVTASHAQARDLAKALADTVPRLEGTWRSYADRFEGADQALAAAIQTLSDETEQYKRRLRDFVGEVDHDFAKSVKSLDGLATTLAEGAEDLSENLQALIDRLDTK
jgi:methyl-accepting chemotaxis protein